MHISIDALGLNTKRPSGLQVYTEKLIQGLAKVDSKNQYTIFMHHDSGEVYHAPGGNFHYYTCPVSEKSFEQTLIWKEFFLNRILKKLNIDLFHAPANILPFRISTPSVLTLHDLISYRSQFSLKEVRHQVWTRFVNQGVQKAKSIITVSHSSENQILSQFPRVKDKLHVIYNGLNFGNYVENYKKIDHDLYLVGIEQKDAIYFKKYTRKFKIESKICFFPPKSISALEEVYRGASAVVFPSLSEGFGFPVIEAMHFGIPVLVSDISIFKEVAGEAALYVNPYNVHSIAKGIDAILTDSILRKRLIDHGHCQRKLYSWEISSKNILSIYKLAYSCNV